jgi:hypothetical protein
MEAAAAAAAIHNIYYYYYILPMSYAVVTLRKVAE